MDSFFGIGIAELFFIALIALIVLGPERLPGAIREVSKYARYFRNLSGELTSQFSEEMKAFDDINPHKLMKELTGELEEEQEKLKSVVNPTAKPKAKPNAKKPAVKPAATAATAAAVTKKTGAGTAQSQNSEEADSAKTDDGKTNSDGADTAAESEIENQILPPAVGEAEESPQASATAPATDPVVASPETTDTQNPATREETVTGANPPQPTTPVDDHSDTVIESTPTAKQPTVSVNGKPAPAEGEA